MVFIRGGLKPGLAALLWLALPGSLCAHADDTQASRDLDRYRPEMEASGAPRVALVIGNSNYTEGNKLPNAKNDAEDIGNVLKDNGFDVTVAIDQNRAQMAESIPDFHRKIKKSRGVGFFYYAGHGIQYEGKSYLIPVDANINHGSEVGIKAVSFDDLVLKEINKAGNKLNILVLDACRDNPLGSDFSGTVKPGLFPSEGEMRSDDGTISVPTNHNTIVAYSTAAGTTAADGNGRNSPYAEHLKAVMLEPDLTWKMIFEKVADKVAQQTQYKQVPFLIAAGSPNGSDPDAYLIPPSPAIEDITIPKTYPPSLVVTPPVVVDLGILPASLAAAALLVLGALFYAQRRPAVSEPVDTFGVLTRDNLGADYHPQAVAYLCEQKTGKHLAAVKEGDRLIIGRDNDRGVSSDITLQDCRISGRHAELSCKAGRFFITDLESTNGTFVGAKALTPYKTRPLPATGNFYFAEPDLAFTLRVCKS